MHEYWHKQTVEKPLFPNSDWEKPERKDMSGRLLIIGGSSGSFHGVAESFDVALKSGIGEVKAIIPESLRKITIDLPHIAYASANQAGSFSAKSKDTILYAAQWAEGVLLSGEYGRNSETAVVLSEFARSYSGFITITKDAVDILHSESIQLAKRQNVVMVCSYSQLQKFAKEIKDEVPFKYSDDLIHIVQHLHGLTSKYGINIITKHGDYLIASSGGNVITTERKEINELWCTQIAAIAATQMIQHHKNMVQALAESILPKD